MDDFAPVGDTFAAESAESDLSDRRETVQLEPVAYDDYDELEPEPVRDREYQRDARDYDAPDYERKAFEAGLRDAAAGMAASAARREEGSPTPKAASIPEAGPDRDLAADAINAARSGNPEEHAWRRPEPVHAEAMATGGAADLDAGLDEADEDDPADEPLPQKVSPADAVQVARLDSEVLVVDGRPRYHVPDCPHLVGKLTEPIPVNEAVELGFSPCGLCRPVDRLVSTAARR
nr:hypothetical protein [Actinoplanes subtropicus]